MAECRFCKTQLPNDHSAVIAQRIEASMNWSRFESTNLTWGIPDNKVMSIGNDETVKLVARKLKPDADEIESGYYGESEYPQGTEFTVFVVLEYGDTERYFKKTGTADSYGDINWDSGHVTEVQPKIVSATVWE